MDFSALTDAELTTMLANTQTHINRILTGAQSGTVGAGRAFSMARLGELQELFSALSKEKHQRNDTEGPFILAQFGEPQ